VTKSALEALYARCAIQIDIFTFYATFHISPSTTDLFKIRLTAAMLRSANLGPSVFLVFYCNFVKHGPFAAKCCAHTATATEKMVTVRFLLFRVCIYCG